MTATVFVVVMDFDVDVSTLVACVMVFAMDRDLAASDDWVAGEVLGGGQGSPFASAFA